MKDPVTAFLTAVHSGHCAAKICGLRRLEDVALCEAQGALAVGLNFWPKSKRFVERSEIARWLPDLPSSLARVGVFVNAPLETVEGLLKEGFIHAAQLHGDEPPEACHTLRERGYPVFKAIGVRDALSLEVLAHYQVDAVVLDAFCPGEYGGSGKTFNWELALRAKEILGETPLILSGGLTASNVASAIERVRPHAVDVASGVENEPGNKSAAKIQAFLEAVQSL